MAFTVVTMEALRRTALVCTVIVIAFATEVVGGHKDEFGQSQGESHSHSHSYQTELRIGTQLVFVSGKI